MMVLTSPVLAQDAALVERVNRLSAYVEDLLEAKVAQQKQITSLEREVASLRKQLERRSGGASAEEVVAVADAVKALDEKHRADIQKVAAQVEKLAGTPAPSRVPPTSSEGWEYTIQPGNTISAIAQAFREDGIKVSVDDILKANPGMDPKRLQPGDVIFIPEP